MMPQSFWEVRLSVYFKPKSGVDSVVDALKYATRQWASHQGISIKTRVRLQIDHLRENKSLIQSRKSWKYLEQISELYF